MLSGQITKTNKVASDATIEARVVMLFACVEWCSYVLLPTGQDHSYGINEMTVFEIIITAALFVGLCVCLLCKIL